MVGQIIFSEYYNLRKNKLFLKKIFAHGLLITTLIEAPDLVSKS